MTIKKVVTQARKAGLSYGEWVAQNDPPKAKQPPKPQANMKLCPICGGWFPRRHGKIYCSFECREIKNNRLKAEKRKRKVIK